MTSANDNPKYLSQTIHFLTTAMAELLIFQRVQGALENLTGYGKNVMQVESDKPLADELVAFRTRRFLATRSLWTASFLLVVKPPGRSINLTSTSS
jgi:hypothetical protein